MRFEKNVKDKYTILKLKEDKLDTLNSPQLKSECIMMTTKGVKNIVLNMADVRYADSSGLSSILTANRLCSSNGGVLVLSNLSDHIEKLINISQLDSVLNILPTEEEAVEAIFMYELEKDIESGESQESAEASS